MPKVVVLDVVTEAEAEVLSLAASPRAHAPQATSLALAFCLELTKLLAGCAKAPTRVESAPLTPPSVSPNLSVLGDLSKPASPPAVAPERTKNGVMIGGRSIVAVPLFLMTEVKLPKPVVFWLAYPIACDPVAAAVEVIVTTLLPPTPAAIGRLIVPPVPVSCPAV